MHLVRPFGVLSRKHGDQILLFQSYYHSFH